jgi:trimeric autotransporter adhesin
MAAGNLSATSFDAVNGSQLFATNQRVSALEAITLNVGSLITSNRREAQRGTSLALAMTDAPLPSAPGRTSYAFNLATYRSEQAMSLSLSHRVRFAETLAITAGGSFAGGRDWGARVGVAGEF